MDGNCHIFSNAYDPIGIMVVVKYSVIPCMGKDEGNLHGMVCVESEMPPQFLLAEDRPCSGG